MKVSIITVCYNRQATIAQSIESVLAQVYPHIEYIVIDGASTDGTQAIIAQYADKITTYRSEKDQGMYDAINKGLALATGDIVGLMHSDDVFYDNKVVSDIVAAFQQQPSAEALYGDGIYVTNDAEQKIVRNRIGGTFDPKRLQSGWLPLHPTVYLKRKVLERYGPYNLKFTIASDTEFLLRYLYQHQINIAYLNRYIVKMRMGGMSTSYSRAWEVLKEDYRIYKHHQLPAFKIVLLKKMRALKQYLTKTK